MTVLPRLAVVPILAPLRHRSYRLFFFGQLVSLIGSWMQTVGQAWLVLTLTNSPFLLGVISALQWSPVLVCSLAAGVVVDRLPKRLLIVVTQSLFLVLALALGLLAISGTVRFWHVAVLATMLGIVNAFDTPARQAFVVEMVGGVEDLPAAIALNSSIFNGARLIGPGLAGLVIAAWGVGIAFLANAASFLAVIAALLAIREDGRVEVAPGADLLLQMREGVAFIRGSPRVLWVLATLGVLSFFAMNFNVFVPVLARQQLHLQASGFGLLMAAQGSGALIGSLLVAASGHRGPQHAYLLWGPVLLCGAQLLLPIAFHAVPAGALLFAAGAGMIMFTATANSTVQLETPDALRGRVMSTYALVFSGVSPFASLLMGAIVDGWGLAAGFLIAGGAGLAGTFGVYALVRARQRHADASAARASALAEPAEDAR
ncbi:MAG TPA: MFS transporter [bacterium]|nr:MFS transporter [bacterium]